MLWCNPNDRICNISSQLCDMALLHGIHFQSKYVGTLEVPRPGSRVEIVAAMRRIRYEFKVKSIKKQKVTIMISVEGVKVSLSTQKTARKKQKLSKEDRQLVLIQHPINRIFYVSHDSQDLKIFSYIVRDVTTNAFKCNVFKTFKKSHAMQIVRTIGEAFEVCNRINLESTEQNDAAKLREETDSSRTEAIDDGSNKSFVEAKHHFVHSSSTLQDSTTEVSPLDYQPRPVRSTQNVHRIMQAQRRQAASLDKDLGMNGVLEEDGRRMNTCATSDFHRAKLQLHELQLQSQETKCALNQVQLLRDQLNAERTARIHAQTTADHLLNQNRMLIENMNQLVNHLALLESNSGDHPSNPTASHQFTSSLPLRGKVANASVCCSTSKFIPVPTSNIPSENNSFLSEFGIQQAQLPDSGNTGPVGDSSWFMTSGDAVRKPCETINNKIAKFNPAQLNPKDSITAGCTEATKPDEPTQQRGYRSPRSSTLATIVDSPLFRSHDGMVRGTKDDLQSRDTVKREPILNEKRYSWDSYMLTGKQFNADKNDILAAQYALYTQDNESNVEQPCNDITSGIENR